MKNLKTVEIFSGTKSFSKVMEKHHHRTLTIDNDPSLEPDIVADILEYPVQYFYSVDVLWASPPCQGFSVAVIGRNWNRDYTPKTPSAELSMKLAKRTIEIIEFNRPKYWFIENPRGMLRKMPFMEEFLRRQGGGPAYDLVLSIWRYATEAYRYLDQLLKLEAKTYLQAWRTLS